MSTIKDLKDHNIIKYGNFILKSGEESNIYINLKNIISYPNIHKKISSELSNKINPKINIICGTPYGAISFASIISISNNIPSSMATSLSLTLVGRIN